MPDSDYAPVEYHLLDLLAHDCRAWDRCSCDLIRCPHASAVEDAARDFLAALATEGDDPCLT